MVTDSQAILIAKDQILSSDYVLSGQVWESGEYWAFAQKYVGYEDEPVGNAENVLIVVSKEDVPTVSFAEKGTEEWDEKTSASRFSIVNGRFIGSGVIYMVVVADGRGHFDIAGCATNLASLKSVVRTGIEQGTIIFDKKMSNADEFDAAERDGDLDSVGALQSHLLNCRFEEYQDGRFILPEWQLP